MTLPTNRTAANTVQEHVDDHNALHTLHNTLEGHEAAADPHSGYLKESVISGLATPAVILGSAAAAGSALTPIRSDSTIAAFDATNPSTQAFADAAAVGTAAFAARRDHKHAMPANPVTAHEAAGDPHTGYLLESVISALATPAVVLGSAAAAGTGTTPIRHNSTIAAFDATAPTISAVGDAAAVGSAAFAARRDHVHGREAFGAPVATADALANGSAVTQARSDHVHRVPGLKTPAATAPGSPVEGDLFYETDVDKLWVYDGAAWVELGRTGAWTDFTPTYVQGVTVTKTINYARWTRLGRTIIAQVSMNATSTGTAGASIEPGVPVAAANAGSRMVGTGQFYDTSSNGGYKALMYLQTTTVLRMAPCHTNSANPLGVDASWPNAVATGDNVTYEVTYEAAAST
jgi:hypothetical protein